KAREYRHTSVRGEVRQMPFRFSEGPIAHSREEEGEYRDYCCQAQFKEHDHLALANRELAGVALCPRQDATHFCPEKHLLIAGCLSSPSPGPKRFAPSSSPIRCKPTGRRVHDQARSEQKRGVCRIAREAAFQSRNARMMGAAFGTTKTKRNHAKGCA